MNKKSLKHKIIINLESLLKANQIFPINPESNQFLTIFQIPRNLNLIFVMLAHVSVSNIRLPP